MLEREHRRRTLVEPCTWSRPTRAVAEELRQVQQHLPAYLEFVSVTQPASDSATPARDLRSLSPLARELFIWASDQPEEAQRFLFEAASRALGMTPAAEQQLVLEAARQCERDTSRTVSEEVYRHWWLGLSASDAAAPPPWPTAEQAKAVFGGRWSEIRKAVQRENEPPRANIRATALMGLGCYLSGPEILAGLRRWWRTLPTDGTRTVTFDAYREWAMREQAKVSPTDQRLAISFGSLNNRYGGWYESLQAAGLTEELTAAELRQMSRGRGDRSDEALIALVRDADDDAQARGKRLDRKHLGEFLTRLREAQICEGELATVPEAKTLLRRFGGFTRALEGARLITEAESAQRQIIRGRNAPIEELARRVRTAAGEVAKEEYQQPADLGSKQYERWRAREIDRGHWAPCTMSLVRRFEVRTFAEVVQRCLAMTDEHRPPARVRAAQSRRVSDPAPAAGKQRRQR